jgi:NAD dependent epimerase/dehydratase family enzyme
MNEKKKAIIESNLFLNESVHPIVHFVQTNAVTQKLNLEATLKNLRGRVKKAQTKAELDAVIVLCNKNIAGLKRYWNRNTKSIAKPITKIKESTFNKAHEDFKQIIAECNAKKKTLSK